MDEKIKIFGSIDLEKLFEVKKIIKVPNGCWDCVLNNGHTCNIYKRGTSEFDNGRPEFCKITRIIIEE